MNLRRLLLATAILAAATSPARSEWTAANVTGSAKSLSIEVKKLKHVELSIGKKRLAEIENGASQLFIHVVQKSTNGISFTVAGSDDAFGKHSKKGGPLIEGRTTLSPGTLVVIGKGSPIWKTVKKTRRAFLEIYSLGGDTSTELTFYVAEEAAVLTSERYVALTEGVEAVKFNVEIKKTSGNHHFKFLADSSAKAASASLAGFGWRGSKKSDSTFNFTKYDKDKIGYVIDSTDPLYCTAATCSYHVQLALKDVEAVEVYFGEHRDLEPLHRNGHTVDVADQIGFVKAQSEKANFFSYQVENTTTVVFTLVPIEGIANLYVNPGFKADSPAQYYYKAEGSAAKRLIVAARDLQGMKLADDKLYVQVRCEHACRYVLKAHTVTDDVFALHPGYSEKGFLAPGEVRQHLLVTREFKGDKVERHLRVKLQTYAGQANL